jgi:serine protease Do
MDQILAHGKVEHGYLGILPQDVTPALAKAFNSSAASGALVGQVTPDSPAAHAGLKEGDIIVEVDGQPVADANQLRSRIGMMNPNTTAKLKVMRGGNAENISVTLGDFPDKEERAGVVEGNTDNGLQGVAVENLTPETVQELKLPAGSKGVVVDQVSPESRAAEAGLQRGDVIKQVNHQSITNVKEYSQAVGAAKKDQPVLLLVDRNGSTMFLAV